MQKIYLDLQGTKHQTISIFENLKSRHVEWIENEHNRYSRLILSKNNEMENLVGTISICVFQYIKEVLIQNYCKQITEYKLTDQKKLVKLVAEEIEMQKKLVLNLIHRDIQLLLYENNQININGYVRFSAINIKLLLKKIIEAKNCIIQQEKEERKFIEMLQLFVSLQDSMISIVHLIVGKYNSQLLDDNGNDLKKIYLDEVCIEKEEENAIAETDLIMSILVTLIPQQIIVHGEKHDKYEQLLRIMGEVFARKLSYCMGCLRCP